MPRTQRSPKLLLALAAAAALIGSATVAAAQGWVVATITPDQSGTIYLAVENETSSPLALTVLTMSGATWGEGGGPSPGSEVGAGSTATFPMQVTGGDTSGLFGRVEATGGEAGVILLWDATGSSEVGMAAEGSSPAITLSQRIDNGNTMVFHLSGR